MLHGSMYAAHWAAPRGRYAFRDDDEGLSGDIYNSLGRQEILVTGRSTKDQITRRHEFLKEADKGNFWQSTKLTRAVGIIKRRLEEDSGRVITFCFSIVVLNLPAVGLRKNNISCLRYDGSIPDEKRFPTITEFQSASGPRVILITSGSGGVGLNLFAASTVIIICPEWSPAKDDQLVGRAYRMGQAKSVQVYRLIANYSMDQRVQEVQALKNDKRNAPLDLNRVDGISAKEVKRRQEALAMVSRVKGFEYAEFEKHMNDNRVEGKEDFNDDETKTNNSFISSSTDEDYEMPDAGGDNEDDEYNEYDDNGDGDE